MNSSQALFQPTLHVVSLEDIAHPAEPLELDELPAYKLEDIGAGMDWGLDNTQNLAFTLQKECWLIEPESGAVLYRVNPADIVLH